MYISVSGGEGKGKVYPVTGHEGPDGIDGSGWFQGCECGDMISYILVVAGACEYSNELSGSIKCREFLD